MTLSLETELARAYEGTSFDVKPLVDGSSSSSAVATGSTFFETNTGNLFRFDGQQWNLLARPAADQTVLLAQILSELRRIRLGHEQVVFRRRIQDPGPGS